MLVILKYFIFVMVKCYVVLGIKNPLFTDMRSLTYFRKISLTLTKLNVLYSSSGIAEEYRL